MEHSLSSLSYKGSIAEAISDAKQQKKLFVVYTSGENSESNRLKSTWIDPTVCEILSKYCILLHVMEGSSEANNFSEIYPQQSIPCITVVGYNGLQLWKNEGFVSADVLASSLEKAWLSLHVQETTAAFLTAALASGEQVSHETSRPSLSGQVNPGLRTSPNDQVKSLDAGQSSNLETNRTSFDLENEGTTKQDGVAFSKQSTANILDEGRTTEASAKAAEVLVCSETEDDMEVTNVLPDVTTKSDSSVSSANTEITGEVTRSDDSCSSTAKSNVVFLSIRLPSGCSSQVQFTVDDTLRMVKDHISKNEAKDIGSFDIAIPYPRKIFNDQDLDRTLSELGFFVRQALILVPHNSSLNSAGGSLHQNQGYASVDTDASNSTDGYWASLRRILSYVNPLSYLTQNSTSNGVPQVSQNGIWNQGTHSNISIDEATRPPLKATGSSRRMPSRFGANIHTLKNEGDDDNSNDRNTFWNGNSTEFGGNDHGK